MKTLVLVPTRSEWDHVRAALDGSGASGRFDFRCCGFGLVAAAARTMQLIREPEIRGVVLAGLAGHFGRTDLMGKAVTFDKVRCHGIGVGLETTPGEGLESLTEMGWAHFEDDRQCITDELSLEPFSAGLPTGTLLSVAAASGTAEMAARRRERFPDAIAEDMEGFAVATACRLAGKRLRILRGICNAAGDRDHANWRIAEACRSIAAGLGDAAFED